MDYRANLSSAIYPMTLADAGRTVINPQADQNFDRRVDPAGEQKDAGIPQALYLENVVPTVSGYQSFGFLERAALPLNGGAAVRVRSARRLSNYIVLFREGTSSFYDVISNYADLSGTWTASTGTVPSAIGGPDKVFTAFVRGTHYAFIPGNLYTVDFPIPPKAVFTSVSGSVAGITLADIVSICASFNYLIAIDDTGVVYWSSTTTPTDFTPSLVTGAGSETPNGAKGSPQFLVECPEGFYVYYTESVVFAKYTGNARYPWKFIPVSDSGGYDLYSRVAGNINSVTQFTIDTSNKIQLIEGAISKVVAPEVSSYLERKKYRDTYDSTTDTFSRETYAVVTTSLFFVEDRYLLTNIDDIWIWYDILLQRYGRLNIHAHYIYSGAGRLYFIPEYTAACYIGTFNIYDSAAEFPCHAMFGKFQYVRDRFLELDGLEIESDRDENILADELTVKVFPTLDGNNFLSPTTLVTESSGPLVKSKCRITGKNLSIMLSGVFNINTLQLDFHLGGKR